MNDVVGLVLKLSRLFKQTPIQFLQQINVKKCQFHPVFGAGIWTHDLSIMSHLPWTLDQGSRVNVCIHLITWRQKITRSDTGFVERLPPPCANLALTLLWSMSIMFWVKNDKNMVHLQKYLMHLGANLALDTLSTASKYFRTASKISPKRVFLCKNCLFVDRS